MNAALMPDKPLSPREREIVCLIARGLSYKLICDRLGMKYGTVCRHVDNMAWKFGHDRANFNRVLVTHYCILMGWIQPGEVEP